MDDRSDDGADTRPEAPPGDDLVPTPLVSRYAIPLTALVAGAQVGAAEQLAEHPSAPLPEAVGGGGIVAAYGGPGGAIEGD